MDWDAKIAKFPKIRMAAEEALELFEQSDIEDIYNPGDLRVIDVAWCFHENGDHEWIVTIQEASPDAYRLQGYIEKELAKRNIAARVFTEW